MPQDHSFDAFNSQINEKVSLVEKHQYDQSEETFRYENLSSIKIKASNPKRVN